MSSNVDLDTQPEKDVRPSRMVSLSLGLVLACGLIIGALIGALVGHFLLDNAFGLGHDIMLGAIVGAVIVDILGLVAVRAMSSQVADKNRSRSSVTN